MSKVKASEIEVHSEYGKRIEWRYTTDEDVRYIYQVGSAMIEQFTPAWMYGGWAKNDGFAQNVINVFDYEKGESRLKTIEDFEKIVHRDYVEWTSFLEDVRYND